MSENLKEERLGKLFLKYIIPSVGGTLSIGLLVFIDTLFIGRGIGTIGLAALSISIPFFSIASIGIGLGIGGATIASIDDAKGIKNQKNKIFTSILVLGVIIGLLITLFSSIFLKQLASGLGGRGETLPLVISYLKIITKFASFYIVPHLINAFIRNDGNPNLSMISLAICGTTNITLDYVFIFIFGWGMEGAALATGLAQLAYFLTLFFHFFSRKNTLKIVKTNEYLKIIKRGIKTGVPSFLSEISIGMIIFVFNYFVFKYAGNTGVSAYSILLNINLMLYLTFSGIAQGTQPIISINYGSKLYQRVKDCFTLAMKINGILGVIFFLTVYFLRKPLILLFDSTNPEVLEIGLKGVVPFFLGVLFLGLNLQLVTFFQSMEFSKISTRINFLRGFFLIILFLMILPRTFGIYGVWLTNTMAELVTLILASVYYKYKFKKIFYKKI